MTPTTRRFVATGGGQVHVRSIDGETVDGARLVYLHQVPASSRMWEPVMTAMAPFAAIAPDTLNLGDSDGTERPLTLQEHAHHLWEAVDALTTGPVVLVGHHTGAALAVTMAAERPDRVRGSFLIGYPHYDDWRAKLAKFRRLQPLDVHDAPRALAEVWDFIDGAFEPDSDRSLVFDAFADRMRAGEVWYDGYVALWNADLAALAERYRGLALPTLLMAPGTDVLSGVADEAGLALGAEVVRTEGGAFVLTERPQLVEQHLRPFVERLTAGR